MSTVGETMRLVGTPGPGDAIGEAPLVLSSREVLAHYADAEIRRTAEGLGKPVEVTLTGEFAVGAEAGPEDDRGLVPPQPGDGGEPAPSLAFGDALLTRREAARLLGMSERGLGRLRAKHQGEFPEPFFLPEITSKPRWSRHELLQFVRGLRAATDRAAVAQARAAARPAPTRTVTA